MKTPDRCPCGGIILADTEDFKTPLCNECYEEVLGSVNPVVNQAPQMPNEDEICKAMDAYDAATGYITSYDGPDASEAFRAGVDWLLGHMNAQLKAGDK